MQNLRDPLVTAHYIRYAGCFYYHFTQRCYLCKGNMSKQAPTTILNLLGRQSLSVVDWIK